MNIAELPGGTATPRYARRAALSHVRALLRATGKPAWATPVLILLGLATTFAETLGITLIVAFLYLAMGSTPAAAEAVGGLLGQALDQARGLFGSPQRMAVGILLLIVARAALAHAYRSISAGVAEQVSESVRNRIHALYLHAPYAFMQRHEQAQLMEVLGTESWLVADGYRSFTRLVVGACSIVVFTGFIVALSWPIALVALAGSMVLSVAARRLSRPAQALGREVKRVHQELGEQMLKTIEGLRTIRAYAQERAHQERFLGLSSEARRASLSLTRLSSLLDPLTELAYLAMLCVIVAGALHWGTGLPAVLAAGALLYRLQPHAREIEGHWLYLAQIEPQLRSVRAMLEAHALPAEPPGQLNATVPQRTIRFERVTFRYGDDLPPALADASFDIPVGRTTALVGSSGAGKTTVVNLLLRLYSPQNGAILVDGVPLGELRRDEWLALLAVAGQDVELIEGTVIDNIRMADAEAAGEKVLEAARAAGVDEFVSALPDGYDTWIGQQGHRFSGGQRQRLGLARALLRRPKLLILDEATSALDAELEQRIRKALAERLPGCTVLVISHHEPALRNADYVVRLDAGRVVLT